MFQDFSLLILAKIRCLSKDVALDTVLPNTCRTLALEC